MKKHKILLTLLLLLLLPITCMLYTGCGKQQILTYGVTFVAGEGVSGTVPTMERQAEGATFKIPGQGNLLKGGYVFDGWNDGTKTYKEGEDYTMGKNSVTFTSQWTNLINVNVNGGGYFLVDGAYTTFTQKVRPGTTLSLAAIEYKESNNRKYRFSHWTVGGEIVSTSSRFDYTANTNTTIVCVYTEYFTVTIGGGHVYALSDVDKTNDLLDDNGQFDADKDVQYRIVANEPEEHKTFYGWATAKIEEGRVPSSFVQANGKNAGANFVTSFTAESTWYAYYVVDSPEQITIKNLKNKYYVGDTVSFEGVTAEVTYTSGRKITVETFDADTTKKDTIVRTTDIDTSAVSEEETAVFTYTDSQEGTRPATVEFKYKVFKALVSEQVNIVGTLANATYLPDTTVNQIDLYGLSFKADFRSSTSVVPQTEDLTGYTLAYQEGADPSTIGTKTIVVTYTYNPIGSADSAKVITGTFTINISNTVAMAAPTNLRMTVETVENPDTHEETEVHVLYWDDADTNTETASYDVWAKNNATSLLPNTWTKIAGNVNARRYPIPEEYFSSNATYAVTAHPENTESYTDSVKDDCAIEVTTPTAADNSKIESIMTAIDQYTGDYTITIKDATDFSDFEVKYNDGTYKSLLERYTDTSDSEPENIAIHTIKIGDNLYLFDDDGKDDSDKYRLDDPTKFYPLLKDNIYVGDELCEYELANVINSIEEYTSVSTFTYRGLTVYSIEGTTEADKTVSIALYVENDKLVGVEYQGVKTDISYTATQEITDVNLNTAKVTTATLGEKSIKTYSIIVEAGTLTTTLNPTIAAVSTAQSTVGTARRTYNVIAGDTYTITEDSLGDYLSAPGWYVDTVDPNKKINISTPITADADKTIFPTYNLAFVIGANVGMYDAESKPISSPINNYTAPITVYLTYTGELEDGDTVIWMINGKDTTLEYDSEHHVYIATLSATNTRFEARVDSTQYSYKVSATTKSDTLTVRTTFVTYYDFAHANGAISDDFLINAEGERVEISEDYYPNTWNHVSSSDYIAIITYPSSGKVVDSLVIKIGNKTVEDPSKDARFAYFASNWDSGSYGKLIIIKMRTNEDVSFTVTLRDGGSGGGGGQDQGPYTITVPTGYAIMVGGESRGTSATLSSDTYYSIQFPTKTNNVGKYWGLVDSSNQGGSSPQDAECMVGLTPYKNITYVEVEADDNINMITHTGDYKDEYGVGESFDPTGLYLNIRFQHGTSIDNFDVTADLASNNPKLTVTGFDTSTAGQYKSYYIAYGNFQTQMSYNVLEVYTATVDANLKVYAIVDGDGGQVVSSEPLTPSKVNYNKDNSELIDSREYRLLKSNSNQHYYTVKYIEDDINLAGFKISSSSLSEDKIFSFESWFCAHESGELPYSVTTVTISELEGTPTLTINTNNAQTNYYVGEDFNPNGLTLRLNYTIDGSIYSPIKDYPVTADMIAVGSFDTSSSTGDGHRTLWVYYDSNHESYYATFDYNVINTTNTITLPEGLYGLKVVSYGKEYLYDADHQANRTITLAHHANYYITYVGVQQSAKYLARLKVVQGQQEIHDYRSISYDTAYPQLIDLEVDMEFAISTDTTDPSWVDDTYDKTHGPNNNRAADTVSGGVVDNTIIPSEFEINYELNLSNVTFRLYYTHGSYVDVQYNSVDFSSDFDSSTVTGQHDSPKILNITYKGTCIYSKSYTIYRYVTVKLPVGYGLRANSGGEIISHDVPTNTFTALYGTNVYVQKYGSGNITGLYETINGENIYYTTSDLELVKNYDFKVLQSSYASSISVDGGNQKAYVGVSDLSQVTDFSVVVYTQNGGQLYITREEILEDLASDNPQFVVQIPESTTTGQIYIHIMYKDCVSRFVVDLYEKATVTIDNSEVDAIDHCSYGDKPYTDTFTHYGDLGNLYVHIKSSYVNNLPAGKWFQIKYGNRTYDVSRDQLSNADGIDVGTQNGTVDIEVIEIDDTIDYADMNTTKHYYYLGEPFDVSSINLQVRYTHQADYNYVPLTGLTAADFTGFDSSTLGTHFIRFSYGESSSAVCEIVVVNAYDLTFDNSVAIIYNDNLYTVDQGQDTKTIKIYDTYAIDQPRYLIRGTSTQIANNTIGKVNSLVIKRNIKDGHGDVTDDTVISHTESDLADHLYLNYDSDNNNNSMQLYDVTINSDCYVSIEVLDDTISNIAIKNTEYKTTYYEGDELDLSNMYIQAYYNYTSGVGAIEIPLQASHITNNPTEHAGDNLVYVSYQGESASFYITVKHVYNLTAPNGYVIYEAEAGAGGWQKTETTLTNISTDDNYQMFKVRENYGYFVSYPTNRPYNLVGYYYNTGSGSSAPKYLDIYEPYNAFSVDSTWADSSYISDMLGQYVNDENTEHNDVYGHVAVYDTSSSGLIITNMKLRRTYQDNSGNYVYTSEVPVTVDMLRNTNSSPCGYEILEKVPTGTTLDPTKTYYVMASTNRFDVEYDSVNEIFTCNFSGEVKTIPSPTTDTYDIYTKLASGTELTHDGEDTDYAIYILSSNMMYIVQYNTDDNQFYYIDEYSVVVNSTYISDTFELNKTIDTHTAYVCWYDTNVGNLYLPFTYTTVGQSFEVTFSSTNYCIRLENDGDYITSGDLIPEETRLIVRYDRSNYYPGFGKCVYLTPDNGETKYYDGDTIIVRSALELTFGYEDDVYDAPVAPYTLYYAGTDNEVEIGKYLDSSDSYEVLVDGKRYNVLYSDSGSTPRYNYHDDNEESVVISNRYYGAYNIDSNRAYLSNANDNRLTYGSAVDYDDVIYSITIKFRHSLHTVRSFELEYMSEFALEDGYILYVRVPTGTTLDTDKTYYINDEGERLELTYVNEEWRCGNNIHSGTTIETDKIYEAVAYGTVLDSDRQYCVYKDGVMHVVSHGTSGFYYGDSDPYTYINSTYLLNGLDTATITETWTNPVGNYCEPHARVAKITYNGIPVATFDYYVGYEMTLHNIDPYTVDNVGNTGNASVYSMGNDQYHVYSNNANISISSNYSDDNYANLMDALSLTGKIDYYDIYLATYDNSEYTKKFGVLNSDYRNITITFNPEYTSWDLYLRKELTINTATITLPSVLTLTPVGDYPFVNTVNNGSTKTYTVKRGENYTVSISQEDATGCFNNENIATIAYYDLKLDENIRMTLDDGVYTYTFEGVIDNISYSAALTKAPRSDAREVTLQSPSSSVGFRLTVDSGYLYNESGYGYKNASRTYKYLVSNNASCTIYWSGTDAELYDLISLDSSYLDYYNIVINNYTLTKTDNVYQTSCTISADATFLADKTLNTNKYTVYTVTLSDTYTLIDVISDNVAQGMIIDTETENNITTYTLVNGSYTVRYNGTLTHLKELLEITDNYHAVTVMFDPTGDDPATAIGVMTEDNNIAVCQISISGAGAITVSAQPISCNVTLPCLDVEFILDEVDIDIESYPTYHVDAGMYTASVDAEDLFEFLQENYSETFGGVAAVNALNENYFLYLTPDYNNYYALTLNDNDYIATIDLVGDLTLYFAYTNKYTVTVPNTITVSADENSNSHVISGPNTDNDISSYKVISGSYVLAISEADLITILKALESNPLDASAQSLEGYNVTFGDVLLNLNSNTNKYEFGVHVENNYTLMTSNFAVQSNGGSQQTETYEIEVPSVNDSYACWSAKRGETDLEISNKGMISDITSSATVRLFASPTEDMITYLMTLAGYTPDPNDETPGETFMGLLAAGNYYVYIAKGEKLLNSFGMDMTDPQNPKFYVDVVVSEDMRLSVVVYNNPHVLSVQWTDMWRIVRNVEGHPVYNYEGTLVSGTSIVRDENHLYDYNEITATTNGGRTEFNLEDGESYILYFTDGDNTLSYYATRANMANGSDVLFLVDNNHSNIIVARMYYDTETDAIYAYFNDVHGDMSVDVDSVSKDSNVSAVYKVTLPSGYVLKVTDGTNIIKEYTDDSKTVNVTSNNNTIRICLDGLNIEPSILNDLENGVYVWLAVSDGTNTYPFLMDENTNDLYVTIQITADTELSIIGYNPPCTVSLPDYSNTEAQISVSYKISYGEVVDQGVDGYSFALPATTDVTVKIDMLTALSIIENIFHIECMENPSVLRDYKISFADSDDHKDVSVFSMHLGTNQDMSDSYVYTTLTITEDIGLELKVVQLEQYTITLPNYHDQTGSDVAYTLEYDDKNHTSDISNYQFTVLEDTEVTITIDIETAGTILYVVYNINPNDMALYDVYFKNGDDIIAEFNLDDYEGPTCVYAIFTPTKNMTLTLVAVEKQQGE